MTAMLHQTVTTLVTMMFYASTSTPSWSSSDSEPPPPPPLPPVGVASPPPAQHAYLARGLTGRVRCPAEDDPPHRLVIWSRRGRTIQTSEHVDDDDDDSSASRRRRFSVDLGGVLVVDEARFSDAGDYGCTLYSPKDDAARLSYVVRVVVTGKSIGLVGFAKFSRGRVHMR